MKALILNWPANAIWRVWQLDQLAWLRRFAFLGSALGHIDYKAGSHYSYLSSDLSLGAHWLINDCLPEQPCLSRQALHVALLGVTIKYWVLASLPLKKLYYEMTWCRFLKFVFSTILSLNYCLLLVLWLRILISLWICGFRGFCMRRSRCLCMYNLGWVCNKIQTKGWENNIWSR